MLALALTLTVLAAPRGLPAAHSLELITQIDNRLGKWLTGAGDRKALFANAAELKSFFLSQGVKPADVAAMVASSLKEQNEKPEAQQLTPTRVLVEYADQQTNLSFFDGTGKRCVVALLAIGTEAAQRYVLLGAPRIDDRTIESLLEERRRKSMLVFAEKDGAWFTGTLPQPPPPDCTAVMTRALKTIYVSEKSYFAEKDSYSNSLSKIGIDAKTLGITSVKVKVTGAAPNQTFTAEVGLKGGLMSIDDKSAVTVVAPCTQ